MSQGRKPNPDEWRASLRTPPLALTDGPSAVSPLDNRVRHEQPYRHLVETDPLACFLDRVVLPDDSLGQYRARCMGARRPIAH